MSIISLKKGVRGRQPMAACLTLSRTSVAPFDVVELVGKNFTGYLGRGNPGIAVTIDGKPLTGCKLNMFGNFRIKFEMPPFTPGIHTIDAFGVQTTVEVLPPADLISQDALRQMVVRDFKIMPDCDMLFSDERYRVIPINVLKTYLAGSAVPRKKYIAEFFDCDNFALSMAGKFDFEKYPKGYAHGELWVAMADGGGHAVTCWCVKLLDGTIKMLVVEPQNGCIFDFPPEWQAFMVKM